MRNSSRLRSRWLRRDDLRLHSGLLNDTANVADGPPLKFKFIFLLEHLGTHTSLEGTVLIHLSEINLFLHGVVAASVVLPRARQLVSAILVLAVRLPVNESLRRKLES
uniref:Uncharacterized protein n=1 Tax=Strombidium inclinatum TaxID=197538 RepID=A0A7S3IH94_9SPIT